MQIGHPGLAFVEDRTAEKSVPFNIEHHFGQTLGLLEEVVRLKSRDCSQSVEWVRFRDRDHIVRNGIDPKFALVKRWSVPNSDRLGKGIVVCPLFPGKGSQSPRV